jgi:hypothetical protein
MFNGGGRTEIVSDVGFRRFWRRRLYYDADDWPVPPDDKTSVEIPAEFVTAMYPGDKPPWFTRVYARTASGKVFTGRVSRGALRSAWAAAYDEAKAELRWSRLRFWR